MKFRFYLMNKEVIIITIEKVINIVKDLLGENCTQEQNDAVNYIEYFLKEYKPVEDYTNTHILPTEAVYNALPLLNAYYQCIPDDSWEFLKEIMFADEEMTIPKRYPANKCNLYLILNEMFHRSINEEYGYANTKKPRPKIMLRSDEYGVLDFTNHYFMDKTLVIHDLLSLSKIWNDLYIESTTATECSIYTHQLEIATWLVGRRLSYDFCELMKWLNTNTDVMDDIKGEI